MDITDVEDSTINQAWLDSLPETTFTKSEVLKVIDEKIAKFRIIADNKSKNWDYRVKCDNMAHSLTLLKTKFEQWQN